LEVEVAGAFTNSVGDKVWINDKRQLILLYADKPKQGNQQRILGYIRQGIWYKEVKLQFEMRQWGHWAVSRLPLQKWKELGYNIIKFKGMLSDGRVIEGFVHPYTVLHNDYRNFKSHDPQHKLLVEDICRSPEEAKARARKRKEEIEAAEAIKHSPAEPKLTQGGLFDESKEQE
jgi:hypothetical protein